jgi:hypothetical protein
MNNKTPKTMVFTTKTARSKQEKSAKSRVRKINDLRKRFATLLGPPGLLNLFGLLLVNARPSDLQRCWAFGNGENVNLYEEESAGMRLLGVRFSGDPDVDEMADLGSGARS